MAQLNSQLSIEQIVVANKSCRLLGLTSVRHGAGVSLICRRVAKTMAVNGMKTLIISLSKTKGNPSWVSSDKPVAASTLRAAIVPSRYGYDLLPAYNSEGRPIALNVMQLRHLIDAELADYNRIVFDLQPLSQVDAEGLSTVAVSVICDRTLLVCAIGTDLRGEVSEAVSILRGAGATLAGIVSNEYRVGSGLRQHA